MILRRLISIGLIGCLLVISPGNGFYSALGQVIGQSPALGAFSSPAVVVAPANVYSPSFIKGVPGRLGSFEIPSISKTGFQVAGDRLPTGLSRALPGKRLPGVSVTGIRQVPKKKPLPGLGMSPGALTPQGFSTAQSLPREAVRESSLGKSGTSPGRVQNRVLSIARALGFFRALRNDTSLLLGSSLSLPAARQSRDSSVARQTGVKTGFHQKRGSAPAGLGLSVNSVPRSPVKSEPSARSPRKGISRRIIDFLKKKTRVFKDPERNSAFWRWFAAYQTFLVGFQMYIVALPYLIQSFTKNTLTNVPGGISPDQLNSIIRQRRSLARIVHWVAQATSYLAIPMFTKSSHKGPRKVLVISSLGRAVVLGLIPVLFFWSGVVSATTALVMLMGLIALQSFIQGIHVIGSSAATSRIMGDKTVTPEERIKANTIIAVGGAVIAIIAPAIAGRISKIRNIMGKVGSGSAIIYGIYAVTMGLQGLIIATIGLLGRKRGADSSADAKPDLRSGQSGKFSVGIWKSFKEGFKALMKNRFLRTMLLLDIFVYLFSDPLVFNVLPEYLEGILESSPVTLAWFLEIPVLGWFMEGLTSTPMGYFALMLFFGSIGSILGSLLLKPLSNFFNKRGYVSEESLTIPFYRIAFLNVLAFWGMYFLPSFWPVVLLYGVRILSYKFAGLVITGIYQKTLGKYSSEKMNQVLAATSFIAILVGIASTYLYGYVLKSIPIRTSLLIAGIVITVLGILRLFAPYMFFNKEQRTKSPIPPKVVPGKDVSVVEKVGPSVETEAISRPQEFGNLD